MLEQIADEIQKLSSVFDSVRQINNAGEMADACKIDSDKIRELAERKRTEQEVRRREAEYREAERQKHNRQIDQQIKAIRDQQEALLQRKRQLTVFQAFQKTQIDNEYMTLSDYIVELQKEYIGK